MKTKFWIILFSALVLAAALAQVLLDLYPRQTVIAVIYQNNNRVTRIDLSAVDSPHTIPILGHQGAENIILVEPGQISVQSATCRDQSCVNQGPISDGVTPIVCLPHRLIIQIQPSPGNPADPTAGG